MIEAASSSPTCLPKVTQAPNENSETFRPDLPKRRYSMLKPADLLRFVKPRCNAKERLRRRAIRPRRGEFRVPEGGWNSRKLADRCTLLNRHLTMKVAPTTQWLRTHGVIPAKE